MPKLLTYGPKDRYFFTKIWTYIFKFLKKQKQNLTIDVLPQRGQVWWLGPEGLQAPTLGRHVSVCTTILRLRALLYQVTCATILGCVCYYIRLHALLCQVSCATIFGSVLYYIRLHTLLYQVACATILGCVRYYIRLRALLCQVACAFFWVKALSSISSESHYRITLLSSFSSIFDNSQYF